MARTVPAFYAKGYSSVARIGLAEIGDGFGLLVRVEHKLYYMLFVDTKKATPRTHWYARGSVQNLAIAAELAELSAPSVQQRRPSLSLTQGNRV